MFFPFLDCKTVSTSDSSCVSGLLGSSTFSLQLCISISKSCICLLFLPIICPDQCDLQMQFELQTSCQSHRCLHCRFLSSHPNENLGLSLFACLHAISHLSSTWEKKTHNPLISIFLTLLSFLSHCKWCHCYPYLSCSVWSSSVSAIPVYLDLDMCFWIQFTSYGLLYLSLNKFVQAFIISVVANPSLLTMTNVIRLIQNVTENIHFAEFFHWAHHPSFCILSLVHFLYTSKINLFFF